ncbi:MAG: hypothetical protein COB41_09660 [Proteobacteria bacterium]|nr:MAG: hypothetical protein COB41_09660 [Pseudomonadota bacterium]
MFYRLLILLCLFSFSACGLIHKPEAAKPQQHNTAKQAQSSSKNTTPMIVMVPEFDDIPVPAKLSRDADRSFVYEAPGVTMGVIIYTGYVKGDSLAKFFRNEMPKYEWQFLNAFSEGDKYLISFIKSDKSCMISVEESTLSTRVTIKVGPTQGR